MINADAQDLGLTSVKTSKLCLVGRNLIGSYRRPRHGKECKDDMPSAQEARKTHLRIKMAGRVKSGARWPTCSFMVYLLL